MLPDSHFIGEEENCCDDFHHVSSNVIANQSPIVGTKTVDIPPCSSQSPPHSEETPSTPTLYPSHAATDREHNSRRGNCRKKGHRDQSRVSPWIRRTRLSYFSPWNGLTPNFMSPSKYSRPWSHAPSPSFFSSCTFPLAYSSMR